MRTALRHNRNDMPAERIYLTVPFAEKDVAETMGAVWDVEMGAWFITAGVDPVPFARWLPTAPPAKDLIQTSMGQPWRSSWPRVSPRTSQPGVRQMVSRAKSIH
jgi:Domain of unknown function (DUF5710)